MQLPDLPFARRHTALLFALLALGLTSCGVFPARKPIGAPPRVTATPGPRTLLDIRGRGNHVTRHFATSPLGWKAHWSYDCTAAGKSWSVRMTARQTRRQFRPSHLPIMAVRSGKRRGRGTTTLMYRGNMYIVVKASPGCRWTVKAVQIVA